MKSTRKWCCHTRRKLRRLLLAPRSPAPCPRKRRIRQRRHSACNSPSGAAGRSQSAQSRLTLSNRVGDRASRSTWSGATLYSLLSCPSGCVSMRNVGGWGSGVVACSVHMGRPGAARRTRGQPRRARAESARQASGAPAPHVRRGDGRGYVAAQLLPPHAACANRHGPCPWPCARARTEVPNGRAKRLGKGSTERAKPEASQHTSERCTWYFAPLSTSLAEKEIADT